MDFLLQEYSKALGRTITYQDIPVGPWRERLGRGLSVHLVNHLATMADLHRAGRYDRMSDDVEECRRDKGHEACRSSSGRMRAFTASAKKDSGSA